jgi:carboxymethylenebutenolidase
MPAAGSSGAVIGFCWGGSRFFDFAAAQKDLKAAVGYYGTAPTDRETLRLIACPVPGSV